MTTFSGALHVGTSYRVKNAQNWGLLSFAFLRGVDFKNRARYEVIANHSKLSVWRDGQYVGEKSLSAYNIGEFASSSDFILGQRVNDGSSYFKGHLCDITISDEGKR